MNNYWYLIIGIIIGWITKFPLVLKWYLELKQTNDYKKRKSDAYLQELKRLEEIYKK